MLKQCLDSHSLRENQSRYECSYVYGNVYMSYMQKLHRSLMDQEIITNTVANNFCNVLTQLKFGKCEISTKTFLEYFPFKNANQVGSILNLSLLENYTKIKSCKQLIDPLNPNHSCQYIL